MEWREDVRRELIEKEPKFEGGRREYRNDFFLVLGIGFEIGHYCIILPSKEVPAKRIYLSSKILYSDPF